LGPGVGIGAVGAAGPPPGCQWPGLKSLARSSIRRQCHPIC
jgi:hypothetical protein